MSEPPLESRFSGAWRRSRYALASRRRGDASSKTVFGTVRRLFFGAAHTLGRSAPEFGQPPAVFGLPTQNRSHHPNDYWRRITGALESSRTRRYSPDDFIPLAERTGFIKPLTIWGLETALRQSQVWLQQGLGLAVSVSLSARNLHDDGFLAQLENLIRDLQIPPEQLELEITESAIMADPVHALAILTSITQMGIALSIDDFGTGYSSLAYLKKAAGQCR
jgi:hypothetical protein